MRPPDLTLVLATAAAAFVAVCLGTAVLLRVLRRYNLLDRPNERSSHAVPTPRGGGIAVMAVLIVAIVVIWLRQGVDVLDIAMVVLPMAGLAAISWADDVRSLGALPRLVAQFLAVGVGVWALPGPWHAAAPAPWDWGLAVLLGIGWIWFINLFNFMDGIDGITGAETLVIGIGVAVVATAAPAALLAPAWPLAVVTAAAVLGFLVWNWHPAKIFLGDVGSVPLGFLLGWLLLFVALKGYWAAAVILPLYYLTDSTVTLVRRLLRGERVWRAHKSHFYQHAVATGRSHALVALSVLGAGIGLVALAWVAARGQEISALVGAAIAVLALLGWMSRRPR